MDEFTQEWVRDRLAYDEATGIFTWLKSGWKTRIGKPAGNIDSHGYLQIKIGQRHCLAHRLAWLWVYGKWPPLCIDHINGVPTDNRIANLRLATSRQNAQNRWRAQSSNKSSRLLGVSFDKGRPFAQIIDSGKRKWLGYFDTPQQAHEAYLAEKARLHEFGELAASYRPTARKESV